MTGRPGSPLRHRCWIAFGWLAICGLFFAAGCARGPGNSDEGPPLRLFAAASLADVMTDLGEVWQGGGEGPVELHLAGSNLLAQQLLAGAPADLFLSAGPGPMERAVTGGAVMPASVQPVAGNRLVVVASPGTASLGEPADLLSFDRLALADPAGVPAGVYARTWLEAEGLWPRLEPRVVPALDVRAALAAVTGGHLPAAVVYATDAAVTPDAAVIYRVPAERAPPIVYLLGTAARPAQQRHPAVDDFRALVLGAPGRAAFQRHGFLPPPEASPR